MNVSQFIEPSDPLWRMALELCNHDFYHLPQYLDIEGSWTGSRPIGFLFWNDEGIMLLPLLEQSTPTGKRTDAVTPYGYSSPVFSNSYSDCFQERAFIEFHKAACERGILTTFVRLHPILCPRLEAISSELGFCIYQIDRGFTATMPLALDADTWRRRIGSNHRRNLQNLEKLGCRLVLDTDSTWKAFPDIYRTTMRRVNANAYYFYSDNYFARVRSELGKFVHCAAIIDSRKEILCASIFTKVNDMMQYHLGGTRNEYIRQAPSKFLFSEMREWARSNGIKVFHLGGGYGGSQDDLFLFKSRFGGEILPFRTLSIVHNAEEFECECKACGVDSSAALLASGCSFPPYRFPV